MTNSSNILISAQEVLDFLRRDLRLHTVYQEIISQKIIHQVAQEIGQSVDADEVQQQLDTLLYEYRFDRPSQLMDWAANHLATLGDIRQRISEKLLSQKLARHLFLKQAQDQFEHYRQNFETISIYKILVPYESLAREIFYQIEEEEISFFEAAHVYDLDERRRMQCGFEGRMQRWQLSPELAELLQDITVGEVVGPKQTANGHSMLLLVDELLTSELVPETMDQLVDNLFQEWLTSRLTIDFNRLRNELREQMSDS
jgi:parvulin-like peptidyl-prolyl isomerase